MNVTEALESYLLSTRQIHPLAARQARMLSRNVRLPQRSDDARKLLLLGLAALYKGSPRADKNFFLKPIDGNLMERHATALRRQGDAASPLLWQKPLASAREAIANLLDACMADPELFAPLFGPPPTFDGAAMPLFIVDSSSGWVGFSRYWTAVRKLEELLRNRLKEPDPLDQSVAAAILAPVFGCESILSPDQRFHYRQAAAAALALRTPLLIVSGGPGTGKTSVVIQILRALIRLFPQIEPKRIVICTPTGRAKARMGESVDQGLEAIETLPDLGDAAARSRDRALVGLTRSTIHSLLGVRPDGSMKFHAGNPLPAQVIVVDEASMVDVHIFASLIEAASPHCRIILMGDMHQLPPVEAGAVLGDLTQRFLSLPGYPTLTPQMARWIDAATAGLKLEGASESPTAVLASSSALCFAGSLADHAVILTHSYRSSATILEVCSSVNRGEAEETLRLLDSRADASVSLKTGDVATAVREWLSSQYLGTALEPLRALNGLSFDPSIDIAAGDPANARLLDAAFAAVRASRILTTTHEGRCGRIAINQIADRLLRATLDPEGKGRFFHGQQVILGRNFHELDLYNGDLGIVLQTKNQGQQVLFCRARRFITQPIERLGGLESAYAITVHKAQGSEFGEVLFVLPEYDSPLLTRQIIYTAITRARNAVSILGSRECLSRAILTQEERPGGVQIA